MSDVRPFITLAQASKISRSSRRLFFTHCNETIEQRGHWHADYIYGAGSSTLIRYNNRFFLLTANHVLKANKVVKADGSSNYQNESPFIVISESSGGFEELLSFLFPLKKWNIGELIDNDGLVIDTKDIVLIELAIPAYKYFPDAFINLDSTPPKDIYNTAYFNGQLLIASGYPIKDNLFTHDDFGEYTHHTNIQRKIITGLCQNADEEPYINLDLTEGGEYSHQELNGMSGGLILNVHSEESSLSWLGMILTGGNNIIRFCPAKIIYPAIQRYLDAPFEIIDPSVTNPSLNDSEEATKILGELLDELEAMKQTKT
ncbi:hypothetical protein [Modicisalibacter muralis]|nr:hypothetical protein [Halomonas muralis]